MAPTARAMTLGPGPSRSPSLATASPSSSPLCRTAPTPAMVVELIFVCDSRAPVSDHAWPARVSGADRIAMAKRENRRYMAAMVLHHVYIAMDWAAHAVDIWYHQMAEMKWSKRGSREAVPTRRPPGERAGPCPG